MFAKRPSNLSRLARNESGSTALIFAAGVTVVLAATGAAIDYSTAGMKHTQLSAAVDSAVLGVADAIAHDGTAAVNNVAAYKALASAVPERQRAERRDRRRSSRLPLPAAPRTALSTAAGSSPTAKSISVGRTPTIGSSAASRTSARPRPRRSMPPPPPPRRFCRNRSPSTCRARRAGITRPCRSGRICPAPSSDTLMASYVYQPTNLNTTATFTV